MCVCAFEKLFLRKFYLSSICVLSLTAGKLSTVVLSESESDDEEKDRKKRSNNPVSRSSTGTAVVCGDSG